jgi:hypothetical protein
MTEPNHNQSKVTLEDLLRLKRHERPPAEYWTRFDRELNERVWRTLVQPKESWTSRLFGVFGRQARWITVGAVSTLALALTWLGNSQAPLKFASNTAPAQTVSAPEPMEVSTVTVTDNAQSLAAIARSNLPTMAVPTQVAAKVLDSSNSAGFHKVPALLAFATNGGEGVRYASDTLSNPAISARVRGSAY